MLRWETLFGNTVKAFGTTKGSWAAGPWTKRAMHHAAWDSISVFSVSLYPSLFICCYFTWLPMDLPIATHLSASNFLLLICCGFGNQKTKHFGNLSKIRLNELRYHFSFIQLVKNIKECLLLWVWGI